jgi:hypothetical protein
MSTEVQYLKVYQFSFCISQFLLLWQNTWVNQLKGGRIYFGSQFSSEVAVHGCLPALLWAYSKAEKRAAHLMVTEK